MCEQASRRLKDAEGERAERSKAQASAAAELEGVRGELAAAHEAVRELEQAAVQLRARLEKLRAAEPELGRQAAEERAALLAQVTKHWEPQRRITWSPSRDQPVRALP